MNDGAQPWAPGPHRLEAADLAARLATDPRHGLAEDEAAARRARYGRNELPRERPTPGWRRLLRQFRDPLVLLLVAATAISVLLWAIERDAPLPYEALAILAVVALNAALGHLQASRAEHAVAALRSLSADDAAVLRAGHRRKVPAADLVPGDVMILEEGDTVPADGRVVESIALRTAEAALTGESQPTSKTCAPLADDAPLADRSNMVWSGTTVLYGRGRVLVTATGERTEVGRIAGLLRQTPEARTPLERELARTGRLLGLAVMAIAAVMIATLAALGGARDAAALADTLILGVALAVAAVPEGLPAVVTAVLALGVERLAARRAIVRQLAAIETLGSASVVASDKTGTLTRNEMTVRAVLVASGKATFGGSGYAPGGEVLREPAAGGAAALGADLERALTAAALANNASVSARDGRWVAEGDPSEAALLVAARKAGLMAADLERWPRLGEVPFSSERKRMSTLHRERDAPERRVIFVKGAPDVLLERCAAESVGGEIQALPPGRREAILRANDELAAQALRTLGLAFRPLAESEGPAGDDPGGIDPELERELVFAGLVGMIDPPREEAAAAVARAKAAGLRPLMITGDHPATASVIARELGIAEDDRVVTGRQLEAMSDLDLDRMVAVTAVYARVDPEHKLRIVDALQRAGAVVAMTGDGVNDAPALKRADVGVAMGIAGTDVARQAADLVLADDNFATLVAAVEEGRAIFDNIRKFLRFLLSSNIGEVLTMFLGVVLAERLGLAAGGGAVVLPLLAVQVLWINLVTDGAPALALGVDPPDEDVMARPPRPPRERVITGSMARDMVLVGVVMAAGTLFVLDAALPGGWIGGAGDVERGRTLAFTTLMLFQLWNVLNARSDRASAFARPFTNPWLWAAVGASLGLHLLVLEIPALQRAFGTVALGGREWLFCALVSSSVLWLREAQKLALRLGRRSVPLGPDRRVR